MTSAFLCSRTELGDAGVASCEAEIDHHVPAPDHGAQIVALVDLADDLQFRNARGAQASSAWPMRPLEPVMMILVIAGS